LPNLLRRESEKPILKRQEPSWIAEPGTILEFGREGSYLIAVNSLVIQLMCAPIPTIDGFRGLCKSI